jgi:putative ABC transport system permease protein
VIGDIRYHGLKSEPPSEVFIPHTQNPYPNLNIVIRTGSNPTAIADIARKEAYALDPTQPVHSIVTMNSLIDDTVAPDLFSMVLLGVMALLALTLAATGIYGLISYMVSLRVREIGIRIALGAQRQDIYRLVIGRGMFLTMIGLFTGITGALLLTRLLSSLLFNVSVTDPLTFIFFSLLLAFIAMIASYIPARRATKVNPMVALRFE